MAGPDPIRHSALAAALAAACALMVAACGGDDDEPTASGSRDDTTETTAPAGEAAGEASEGEGGRDGPGPCDGLDESAVAAVVGDVVDTGSTGGEPSFGRPDGSEVTYAVEGCTFDVAVTGGDEPHVYSVSTGSPLDADIDLFEEFHAARDAADVRPVEGLGDDAFVDATFGDQKVELVVRTDGTVLFVESDPPHGVPVATDDVLVDLAELAIGEACATTGPAATGRPGGRPGGRAGVRGWRRRRSWPCRPAPWPTG